MQIPTIDSPLSEEQIQFLETFSKSCRRSIIEMTKNSQSGHPGGSLSCIDYLTLLYTAIISQSGEKIVVSNGHISPGVYSVLGEMGYIDKEKAIETFRKRGSIFEGHITRHVDGVWYGTGPLGVGVSVAAAFAKAEKMRGTDQKVYGLLGDGEAQEGQVHEMIQFAQHYKLNNLILFVDYNKVQLTASLAHTINTDIVEMFKGGLWHVIEIDGHDYAAMWKALQEAETIKDKPVVLVGHTIMGQGVEYMAAEGREHKATWHGKTADHEKSNELLATEELTLSEEEKSAIEDFKSQIKWKPTPAKYPEKLSKLDIDTGEPIQYDADTVTDCRSAYGKALLDLAKRNKQVIALTADLKGSVKTDGVSDELPEQYIECGIMEQHMVSAAGALSLDGFVPFASTFGAFMSSRAKDQARVNDINYCNVKMVSTHCGLSVGEDGPTHQAIDDMGSFLGMFNTHVIEPADPNQTDRIIRYVASHFGNFYVRMGRHKFPVVKKQDGTPFYDENYTFEYGKSDIIREGSDLTIVASGPMVNEALQALDQINASVELIAVSSLKKFDETIENSIKKTGKVVTIEDHNTLSGFGSQLARHLALKGITPEKFEMIGVEEYQLSGTSDELYDEAGISSQKIVERVRRIL